MSTTPIDWASVASRRSRHHRAPLALISYPPAPARRRRLPFLCRPRRMTMRSSGASTPHPRAPMDRRAAAPRPRTTKTLSSSAPLAPPPTRRPPAPPPAARCPPRRRLPCLRRMPTRCGGLCESVDEEAQDAQGQEGRCRGARARLWRRHARERNFVCPFEPPCLAAQPEAEALPSCSFRRRGPRHGSRRAAYRRGCLGHRLGARRRRAIRGCRKFITS
ncbi:hypothetical protein BD626DRAFT_597324 [Schizophyllum amplum]|uniref:Uncharacterized protein n=1 Tax=Schizophyllum amplum TaxID=97359 RepID=A0A550CAF3_9AGAR|nr:hypothetical protein BD626DRAFT_597324 [Auriculariopsis ampla]